LAILTVLAIGSSACEEYHDDPDGGVQVKPDDPCALECVNPTSNTFECVYPQDVPCGDGGLCDGAGECSE